MSVIAVVQVRMSSKRLPGKVLYKINSKPMLKFIVERLQKSTKLSNIVIATSDQKSDMPIKEFCINNNYDFFCGDLLNVSKRFYDLFNNFPADAYVRICGDSPMIDQEIVDTAVNKYMQKKVDLVTNKFPRSFPKGQTVEVFSSNFYKNIYSLIKDEQDFEHVTTYIYKNSHQYIIENIHSGQNYGTYSLTIDDKNEMDIFKQMVHKMNKPHWQYNWKEMIDIKESVIFAV